MINNQKTKHRVISTWSALLLVTLLLGFSSTAIAQPAPKAEAEKLQIKLDDFTQKWEALVRRGDVSNTSLNDVGVYAKAAEWILRHQEFYKPTYVADTSKVLDTGLARIKQLQQGQPDWGSKPGRFIVAYRSRVDGSLQPYAVSLPEGFDPNPKSAKRWPLHLVLHGRGGTLNEVSFIRSHDDKPPTKEQDWIQVDVFGRINNAYRWAGETDIFEALEDAGKRFKIDESRITLHGFSMGGAGAWHIGLHHPSKWSSVGAGAGFVDFYKYQKVDEPLPEYQDKALRIYDTTNYAGNLANVPFVTYGGELDSQLAASLTMQQLAKEQDVPLKVIIGPKMGHKFDDASKDEFMAFHAAASKKGRATFPGKREIDFTTYTLKYNRCEWLTIAEVENVYEQSRVTSKVDDDGTLQVTTKNITALKVARGVADRVAIDAGAPIQLESAAEGLLADVYFVKATTGWSLLDYEASLEFDKNTKQHKRHDLQGPIDDAFMESFIAIRGTGKPWNTEHQQWADWTFTRFEKEFDKWMRGTVRTIDDTAVVDELIASNNLILFGDPGSNNILAQVIDKLPVEWTADKLTVAGKTYDTRSHGLAMIFPNPLNPQKYIVINSGMTTHEPQFKPSNAQHSPRLGDIAIIEFKSDNKLGYTETTSWAELFDAQWKLPDSK